MTTTKPERTGKETHQRLHFPICSLETSIFYRMIFQEALLFTMNLTVGLPAMVGLHCQLIYIQNHLGNQWGVFLSVREVVSREN